MSIWIKMGHYVKCVLDDVLGAEWFVSRNCLAKSTAHNHPVRFGSVHDPFFTLRNRSPVWNILYCV